MIIAIDGPSGAGKSTLGRIIARELGYLYIDTGAMYRAVAQAVLESKTSLNDAQAVAAVAATADIKLEGDPDSLRVTVNGQDVSEEIRTEAVSHASSVISTIPEVRRTLVDRQRKMGAHGRVVLDGRDIGTVVFPNADIKFFLTAQPQERAERRFKEERLRERDVTYEETLSDINARDQRDSTRADSPLAIADNAVVIDSTDLSIEEVAERMLAFIRERQAERENEAQLKDRTHPDSF